MVYPVVGLGREKVGTYVPGVDVKPSIGYL